MADHVIEQIAEAMVALLSKTTSAHDRVYRDRAENFESLTDLPAIDIRIAEDDPIDGSANGAQRGTVRINVDLYVAAKSERTSSQLLELRKETYQRLMAGAPRLPGAAAAESLLNGGAEAMLTSIEGSVPLGYLRTVFFVNYRHSLTDPSQ